MSASAMVERIDDLGRPAWIGLMVLGFIVFWPFGLALLAYLIWSGRMGCGRSGDMTRWQSRMAERFERKAERWGMQARASAPTGNKAFDDYRSDVLRRLEDEAEEFRSYLERLRMAKDKAEFDQFMSDRRSHGTGSPEGSNPGTPPPS